MEKNLPAPPPPPSPPPEQKADIQKPAMVAGCMKCGQPMSMCQCGR